MISRLELTNFKIHKATHLDFAPLTILTGINGMGKSSVTQSLLMLRDSVNGDYYPRALRLQGPSFSIVDNSGSLVNWYANETPDRLSIKLQFEKGEEPMRFDFIYPLDNVTELARDPESPAYSKERLEAEGLFNDNFQYLSAFRFGPEAEYKGDTYSLAHRQVSYRKGQGEYAVAVLERYRNEDISVGSAALPDCNGSVYDLSLFHQTSLWLGKISPNISLSIDTDGNRYSLRYNYPSASGKRRSVAPINTGYGISYSLSVVVALLVTPPGGLVVIENPEAHIHPAAQSALMQLISRVVAGGVQVVIETHSDHIVFGSLVNLKQGLLQPSDLHIHHFDINDRDGQLQVSSIVIGPDSRVKNAPRHFIEQMNLDLDILFDESYDNNE